MKVKVTALIVVITVLAVSGFIFALDYIYVRSAASFALLLNELPEGTPFEEFQKRFGEPSYHFSDEEIIKEWGPSSDPRLIKQSELFYFFCRTSIPFRYICVYRDKNTGRVERVMWKSM